MVLFLAINTAGIQILPISVIAVRAAKGSTAPGAIVLPTIIASALSLLVAVAVTLVCQRLFRRGAPEAAASVVPTAAATSASVAPLASPARRTVGLVAVAALALILAYAARGPAVAGCWQMGCCPCLPP